MVFGYTETEQLDLFLEKVAMLGQTRMIQAGELQTRLHLSYRHTLSLRVDATRPDEEILRSFLLIFRQFVSDREPVFVNRIANLCWNNTDSDYLRQELETGKAHWKAQQRGGPAGLTINQMDFTPAFVLDLMINGIYFHSDARKRATVKQLDWLSGRFVEHVFLNYLIEATKYVVFLRNVIIIGRQQGVLRV